MSTRTMTRRSTPEAGAGRSRAHRRLAALAATLLLAAAPTTAQDGCDPGTGTLGIQGMRCEGCTFSMSEEGITEARFRTEPQIIAVARGFAEGDRLRAGDRIVAVDGALITTRQGSDRLVGLRTGQDVTVRVRRNGGIEELRMVAGSACELSRQARAEEIELERLTGADLPPGYGAVELPGPPPADAPLPPPPAMPAIPAMPPMPPSGYLGFGIKCGPCGVRDGVRFFDENPPVVTNVVEDGPADEAGLEPGDVILAIDGLDITEEEGGERFSGLKAGQRVELTIRRGDARRTLTLEVGGRAARRAAPGARVAPSAPNAIGVGDRIRFEGTLGDVGIEVRGAAVTVTRDEDTGELVIRTATNVIRLTHPGG